MREIADDRDNLTYTYGELVRETERTILAFEKKGIIVDKQVIPRQAGGFLSLAQRGSCGAVGHCRNPGSTSAPCRRDFSPSSSGK